jgi:hypothetical protein
MSKTSLSKCGVMWAAAGDRHHCINDPCTEEMVHRCPCGSSVTPAEIKARGPQLTVLDECGSRETTPTPEPVQSTLEMWRPSEPNFTPVRAIDNPMVCSDCYSMVCAVDIPRHKRWHRAFDIMLNRMDEAAGKTPPLLIEDHAYQEREITPGRCGFKPENGAGICGRGIDHHVTQNTNLVKDHAFQPGKNFPGNCGYVAEGRTSACGYGVGTHWQGRLYS